MQQKYFGCMLKLKRLCKDSKAQDLKIFGATVSFKNDLNGLKARIFLYLVLIHSDQIFLWQKLVLFAMMNVTNLVNIIEF